MRRATIHLTSILLLLIAPFARAQEPGDEWIEPVTGMEFVWVPGGCYEMGCGEWAGRRLSENLPVDTVCVEGFWLGKYEVTQEQWMSVMDENPALFTDDPDNPVEHVSWEDVQMFIAELESMNQSNVLFRLPNEAEWEYACTSGGKREMYSGGNDVDTVAWYTRFEYEAGQTHPIGMKIGNGLGLYDMSGNVMEYVEYWYAGDIFIYHGQTNPMYTDGGTYRIVRGGSWISGEEHVRCVDRARIRAHWQRDLDVGFRLLRIP